jgi:hypothetical protein
MGVCISGIKVTEDKGKFSLESLINSANAVLDESKITITKESCWNRGVFLGTTFSNFSIREVHHKTYLEKGVRAANPTEFPKGLISYLGGQICVKLNLKGINSTVSSSLSSGIDALAQGIFFVNRDRANKALVVELGERVETKRAYATKRSVSLVIENSFSLEKKSNYGDILTIESFFEKKGQSQGLVKAIKKALKRCALDVKDLDCIMSCASCQEMFSLEKEALSRFSDPAMLKAIFVPTQGESIHSALFSIVKALKNDNLFDFSRKKDFTIMFLAAGQNTNSSCAIIKVAKRGG